MEQILEQQRCYHEERERIIDAMVAESLLKKNSKRECLNSEHRQRILLNRYMDCSKALYDIYEDKDGQRKAELLSLSGPNEFSEFYIRLKQIKEFHRRHPEEDICVPMSVEFDKLRVIRESLPGSEDYNQNLVEFSDEEGYGKYLDLHLCYDLYINLKGVERVDYVTYLVIFDKLYDIPREHKGAVYSEYINTLLDYLYDYAQRVKPLINLAQELDVVVKEMGEKFDDGEFPGWPKETESALAYSGAHLDLSPFSSADELASLGLDRLKSALLALGLKCGGTLEQRALRLFSTKGKQLNELNPVLFAKSKPGTNLHLGRYGTAKNKLLAGVEAQIYFLCDLLAEQKTATRENVERKQARTEAERDDSDEEELPLDDVDNAGVEGDEGDDIPYNPKNLPLGWDGKPIPYWLYKLHGLNISYTCEICGNFVYKGPKTFQRHFSEWRHAHGMRCLGIPNTAHFANVTQIEDSMALWEKIKMQKHEDMWKPEQEEEFEDSQGNVVNRKIYEDLKRQGLL